MNWFGLIFILRTLDDLFNLLLQEYCVQSLLFVIIIYHSQFVSGSWTVRNAECCCRVKVLSSG